MAGVRVRFAPSPTGALHIGSVRTALFNWLYARHCGGQFLLRIEDTDKERSTKENTEAIFKILRWLRIDWDEEPVTQSERIDRHREVALELLKSGNAYYCYCTQEELAQKKEITIKAGGSYSYDRKCRDTGMQHRPDTKPVIRLKTQITGTTTVNDMIQGDVTIDHSRLDDLVLLRSDGSPTYMLSVVVDDHDMGITHVIRGDDHLTNTFRQIQIYKACNWRIPQFGHIPLIYGPDGAKLSKRHGAASANDYYSLGYLPSALLNYLVRLGWSHGDDEIISREQAIEWFDLTNVGKSPSRFDMAKLQNLNSHYIRQMANDSLLDYMEPFLGLQLDEDKRGKILRGMNSLKERAKTIVDLANSSKIYTESPVAYASECAKYATSKHLELLRAVCEILGSHSSQITEESLQQDIRDMAAAAGIKLVEIAQALRGALCGRLVSPSVFEIIAIIGWQEATKRIENYIRHFNVTPR